MITTTTSPSSEPADESPGDSLVRALSFARSKTDVATLLRRHDHSDVAAAWAQLPAAHQSALLLVRGFDGVIVDADPHG
jgi:DNA-directed RNA polymerase specialized sigma24 family protein